ncbi:MAG: DUF58 domain-containing protein, partial [Chitinophagaceae bacterium]
GMEFAQYRSYQPGDDLRSLDWKMFARSDRYYIRESETETSVSVRLVVDASGSMDHVDGSFKRIAYAKYLAASLAWLANQQGDAIGLYVFKEDGLFSLPCRKDHQHLSRFFYNLENISPAGKFTEAINYKDIFSGSHKRELLIFITDFFETNGEISELLKSLAAMRHEMMLFHVLGKNEMDFDFKGYQAVEDLETGKVVSINQQSAARLYKQQLESFIETKKTFALENDIFYRLTVMNESVETALRDFINQRNKMKG